MTGVILSRIEYVVDFHPDVMLLFSEYRLELEVLAGPVESFPSPSHLWEPENAGTV